MPKFNFQIKILKFYIFIAIPLILSGCSTIGRDNPAALQITSTPESAVFLDGKHLGKTPFFSDQLKSGEYTLKISAGEAQYVEIINLHKGTLTVLNRELNNNILAQSGETLWLDPSSRGFLVITNPPGSDINVDGTLLGTSPYSSDKIVDGDHKVIISKKGFGSREFTIKTSQKYQLTADVTLASLTAKELANQSQNILPKIKKVEILKSPQGFLRVREKPELSAVEIGRVTTGTQVEVVQEADKWLKIIFEEKQGWISTQNTKKI